MSISSPYKGLAPFEDSELDALFFFGRERDTEIVVANLIASRLTVLYGPSGVGKSSLLLAAVARQLRELPEAPLVVVFSSWGDDPAESLAAALADAAGIEPGELLDTVDRAQAEHDAYLILDQAEEYFLYHQTPTRFERDLAAIVGGSLRVNTLLSVREDALATLDRFQASIPALYSNVLRLERLDHDGARAAIVRPVERFSEVTGEVVAIDAGLVRAVIGEVEAERIQHGVGGEGVTDSNGHGRGVEAPYLQAVMQRLWDVERASGSNALTLRTLDRLGGARRIVADHLGTAVDALEPRNQDLAAAVFSHLVTPSGMKIGHSVDDLAAYASVPVGALTPVLDELADRRILRRADGGRYEIFHDVLAAEVLAWRRRHDADRAVERERAAGRRRQRRLGVITAAALIGVAVTAGLAVWALTERSNAEQQASAAQAAEQTASEKAALAVAAQTEAQRQAKAASRAKQDALAQAFAAKKAEREAESAQSAAEKNAEAAREAEQRAVEQARVARAQSDRADSQAAAATRARRRAQAQALAARSARDDAQQATNTALRAKASAERQAVAAAARERLASARALLGTDPEGALQAALESLNLDSSASAEPVLREGLLRSRVLDVLPGGGGQIASLMPGANTEATEPLRSRTTPASGGAIVTVTRRGLVRAFDAQLGSLLRTIDIGAAVNCAVLAPDRRTLAIGGPDGSVRLYSIGTGKALVSLGHVGPVSAVAFSPDGRLVATAGANQTAKIWDVESGALVRRIEHPRAVRSVAFNPSGTRLLTLTSDRFARVFDVPSGRLIARLDQVETPTSAAFSPDGRRVLTTGEDEVPHIWDAETGVLVTQLEGHTGNVLAGAWSADGARVVTGSTDGTARVWEAQTARLVAQLIGHTSFVDAVTFSPDGRQVLTASRDGTARLWNALTGAPQAQLLGHHGRVTSATFTTDGSSAVTSGEDGTARTWSVHSDPQLRTVADGPSPITDIGTTVDGTVVVEGRRDGTVTVRSADGRPVVEVQLAEPVTSVALSPDGRNVLATGAEGAIGVWTANGSTVALLRQSGSVTAGVFLPDGRAVITAAADGLVRSWDLATQRAKIVAREKAPVADVAVDPEGVSIATAVGDIARVRPLGRRGRAVDFVGHRDALTSVSFSSDGARLLTTSFDHDAAIWDARTGRRTKTLVGHVAVVRGAAFSADGRWIATAGPTRAGLWESRASSLVDSRLYYVSGHRGAIAAVVFAGSGWRIFSGGSDGTLRRYDCRLCTDTEGLRRIAARKLARLEDDKKR